MIVNIRGMSGSGKSTAVKNIMKCYNNCEVLLRHNKKILLYELSDNRYNSLIVIGPYESEHGAKGCDVVGNSSQVKFLAKHFSDCNYDVLFESYMISISPTLICELADDNYNVSALLLDVDTEVVKEQRKNRALLAGKSGEFSTTTDMRTNPELVRKAYNKIVEHGIAHTQIVSQQNVVQTYFDIVGPRTKSPTGIGDLWDLQCRYDNFVSKRLANKKLPSNLFGE